MLEINGFSVNDIYLDELYDLYSMKDYVAVINDGKIIEIVKE